MAKTLLLGEKDVETYLASVSEYFVGGLPASYRDFAIGFREEGFSAAYTAFMIKKVQEQLNVKIEEILRR